MCDVLTARSMTTLAPTFHFQGVVAYLDLSNLFTCIGCDLGDHDVVEFGVLAPIGDVDVAGLRIVSGVIGIP
jgi:hypothetical protein